MRLINADKLIEKLSTNLDNPEEFPVISLGTVMRMIANEDEVQPERKMGRWEINEHTYAGLNRKKLEMYELLYRNV